MKLLNQPSGSDLGQMNDKHIDTFGGSIIEDGGSSESSPERSLPKSELKAIALPASGLAQGSSNA